MNRLFSKIIFLSFVVLLTGCSGIADYNIDLPNNYYIAKTSAHNIKIYKHEDSDLSGNAPTIPIYHDSKNFDSESIIKFGQKDKYIVAQTNINKYYILDTKNNTIEEFSTKVEFNKRLDQLKIYNVSLNTLD